MSVGLGLKQVWRDLDKRNTGERLVQVLAFISLFARGGMQRYAVCMTLTAGGRPFMGFTATPEKVGQGLVGETTLIRVDRLQNRRLYEIVKNLAA